MYIQSINSGLSQLNFNGKKPKNNDKKVSTPPQVQSSSLKAVPLAVLMAMGLSNAPATEMKASEKYANVETTEFVSNVAAQQSSETISPENKKIFEKLNSMMFGPPGGEQIDIKSTDDVFICLLKDIRDDKTGKRLGDAIFIQYVHPENEAKFNKLKNAGVKPNSSRYPTEETYMIPIGVFGGGMDLTKSPDKEKQGIERYVNIKTDFFCYKYERYPEPVCDIYGGGAVISKEDHLRYFNFNKDGWHSFQDGNDRCGMTKSIPVTLDDAWTVVNFLNKHYPPKK